MKIHKTFSADETKKLGRDLARLVLDEASRRDEALVVSLKGNLGSGKTTLVQGFLRGLGVKGPITSPTFVLMKHYKAKGHDVYHLDAYRLRSAEDLEHLGAKELLGKKKTIFLIEWPERVRGAIPKKSACLTFSCGREKEERTITVSL